MSLSAFQSNRRYYVIEIDHQERNRTRKKERKKEGGKRLDDSSPVVDRNENFEWGQDGGQSLGWAGRRLYPVLVASLALMSVQFSQFHYVEEMKERVSRSQTF